MQRDEADDCQGDGDAAKQRRDAEAESLRDDGALLQRLQEGDGDALRSLMDRYDRLVRYVVFRLCRSHCERDPAFLDARASEAWSGFVHALRQPNRGSPDNVKSYLVGIARNKCADALRRLGRPQEVETSELGEDLTSVQAESPVSLELLIQAEQVVALRKCVESLSDDDKRLYGHVEHLVAGRWTLVAQAMGQPESTVRTRWSAVVAQLKACLRKKT
ncbi:MAG: sigma-70 family RNA polymerase sigma factor [bacterium]|nr:sigma-70 family RNA polymerase sigma factor [bacterium]